MARASGWIDLDVLGDVARASFREAEFHEQVGNVLLIRLGRGIFFGQDRIQFGFAVRVAGAETVVPDIERLERAVQTRFDQLRHLWDQGRGEHLLEHRLQPLLGNLAIFIEAPVDERGRGRRIRIG